MFEKFMRVTRSGFSRSGSIILRGVLYLCAMKRVCISRDVKGSLNKIGFNSFSRIYSHKYVIRILDLGLKQVRYLLYFPHLMPHGNGDGHSMIWGSAWTYCKAATAIKTITVTMKVFIFLKLSGFKEIWILVINFQTFIWIDESNNPVNSNRI